MTLSHCVIAVAFLFGGQKDDVGHELEPALGFFNTSCKSDVVGSVLIELSLNRGSSLSLQFGLSLHLQLDVRHKGWCDRLVTQGLNDLRWLGVPMLQQVGTYSV